MGYRTRIWLLWLIPALLTLIALIGIGWQVYRAVPDPESRDLLLLWLVLAAFAIVGALTMISVSYTHLDVYKRQGGTHDQANQRIHIDQIQSLLLYTSRCV